MNSSAGPPPAKSANPGGATPTFSLYAVFWIVPILLIAILAHDLTEHHGLFASAQVASLLVNGRVVSALDDQRHERWRAEFETPLDARAYAGPTIGGSPRWLVEDIDGDGRREVLFVEVPAATGSPHRFHVFDSKGVPRWTYPPRVHDHAEMIAILRTVPAAANQRAIVVHFCGLPSHQGLLHLLAADGRILTRYEHGGHLDQIAIAGDTILLGGECTRSHAAEVHHFRIVSRNGSAILHKETKSSSPAVASIACVVAPTASPASPASPTEELVDKYQPSVIWGDVREGPIRDTQGRPVPSDYWNSKEVIAYLYNHSKDPGGVVTNDRWGIEADGSRLGDFSTPERRNLNAIQTEKWELCDSLDPFSWGYSRILPEGGYMTANQLVDYLADVVSKNGNLLINIGPRADGTIPEVMQSVLRETGAWLKVNGEAIYASRPFTTYKEGDFRFTRKGNAVYAIALEWPEDPTFTLAALAGHKVQSVDLLGLGPVKFTQAPAGVTITMPGKRPCKFAYTFKISTAK